jgi:hypothetical protein
MEISFGWENIFVLNLKDRFFDRRIEELFSFDLSRDEALLCLFWALSL